MVLDLIYFLKIVWDLAFLFYLPNSGLHLLQEFCFEFVPCFVRHILRLFSVRGLLRFPLDTFVSPSVAQFRPSGFDTWCLPLVLSNWCLPLVLGSISCLPVDMIGGAGKPFVDTFHEVVFFSQLKVRGNFSKSKSNREKEKRKRRCPQRLDYLYK